jgi:hypothetical protein
MTTDTLFIPFPMLLVLQSTMWGCDKCQYTTQGLMPPVGYHACPECDGVLHPGEGPATLAELTALLDAIPEAQP